MTKKVKKKQEKREHPALKMGFWIFVKIKAEEKLEPEDFFDEVRRKLKERKCYSAFGDIPFSRKTLVARVDLEEAYRISSMKELSVIARSGKIRVDGKVLLNKDGEECWGWVGVWDKFPEYGLKNDRIKILKGS